MVRRADTDIDIDFQDRSKALEGLSYIQAANIDDDGVVRPHTVGIYFQDIPYDPMTHLSTLDTSEAEERGYFKFDFLNVSLYDGIKSEDHLNKLINDPPLWEMLEDEFFVKKLWHIHDHFEIVEAHQPKNVEQLAMVLSIIRPAKRHLIGLFWPEIEKDVWNKPLIGDKGYEYRGSFFKRSHATAYSLGIVVQMNLIAEDFR